MIEFEGYTPIFRVEELARAREYYVNVLGFGIDFEYPDFASIGRGKAELFLVQGDQGHTGSWLYIGVNDVDVLHEEYAAKGAKIRIPPTNFAWGRELHIEDTEGNVIRFGSARKEGEPAGDWLDMNGERWRPQPDGSWKRVP